MNNGPDDLRWLPESRMLDLCRLPRSVLNSWKRVGLDLTNEVGAYGLEETVSVVLLGAAREHIKPKEMTDAWRGFVEAGGRDAAVAKARDFGRCERFDLIVDPRYAALSVATSDAELIDAVCHPGWPRPVVVVDVAEGIAAVTTAFHRVGSRTEKPRERKAGRPRNAARARVVELSRERRA
jgi:hypothetical protein